MQPLSSLEIATSLVLGREPGAPPLPPSAHGVSTLAALEATVLPALERRPCGVSFSGGRDSSIVLAVATRVARREGLPDPVPVTARFPGIAAATEDGWQEDLVRHLGLAEWERLDFTDELDLVGPYARRVLARHGLLWPCNTHFHLPLIEHVAGGALLTGIGGDEVFEPARHRRALETARSLSNRSRAGRHLAAELMPRRLRRIHRARRVRLALPWLDLAGERLVDRAWADHAAEEPHGWARGLAHWYSLRYRWVGAESLDRVAAPYGVEMRHPLSDAAVVAAAANEGGTIGPCSRAEAIHELVPGLLPRNLAERGSKASFDEAFWNKPSRSLAATMEPGALEVEFVDGEALAAHWRSRPMAQSFLLLQAAWLRSHRGGAGVPTGSDRSMADYRSHVR